VQFIQQVLRAVLMTTRSLQHLYRVLVPRTYQSALGSVAASVAMEGRKAGWTATLQIRGSSGDIIWRPKREA